MGFRWAVGKVAAPPDHWANPARAGAIWLRERESQPYHIQPAVPERLSVGQRPGAQLRQPPQSASPVGASQPAYSYKAKSTGRKHGVLAEELATQKLQEAQRLRDW